MLLTQIYSFLSRLLPQRFSLFPSPYSALSPYPQRRFYTIPGALKQLSTLKEPQVECYFNVLQNLVTPASPPSHLSSPLFYKFVLLLLISVESKLQHISSGCWLHQSPFIFHLHTVILFFSLAHKMLSHLYPTEKFSLPSMTCSSKISLLFPRTFIFRRIIILQISPFSSSALYCLAYL